MTFVAKCGIIRYRQTAARRTDYTQESKMRVISRYECEGCALLFEHSEDCLRHERWCKERWDEREEDDDPNEPMNALDQQKVPEMQDEDDPNKELQDEDDCDYDNDWKYEPKYEPKDDTKKLKIELDVAAMMDGIGED